MTLATWQLLCRAEHTDAETVTLCTRHLVALIRWARAAGQECHALGGALGEEAVALEMVPPGIVQPPVPLPQPPNREGLRDNQSRALCCLRATCRAVQEAREGVDNHAHAR